MMERHGWAGKIYKKNPKQQQCKKKRNALSTVTAVIYKGQAHSENLQLKT